MIRGQTASFKIGILKVKKFQDFGILELSPMNVNHKGNNQILCGLLQKFWCPLYNQLDYSDCFWNNRLVFRLWCLYFSSSELCFQIGTMLTLNLRLFSTWKLGEMGC